ncbi:MAG TPA: DNA polymerase domain-containing protein [Thermoplasmata archaeon]|nr:DNA polymerase domain-containing protein [Thermoplasmata archaeon]
MPDGWLLDITEHRDGQSVDLWLKHGATGRVTSRAVPFRPPFLVDGPRPLLERLHRRLADDPRVAEASWSVVRPSLFDRRKRRLLAVVPERNSDRRRIAAHVDAIGDYHRCTLYDVDLTAPQLYHLAHDLYPFAPVRWDARSVTATRPAEAIDLTAAPVAFAPFAVELAGFPRGGIVAGEPPIARMRLGEATLEGPEAELFPELMRELARQEPDLLLTDGGDGFDLPRLYRRAEANGFTPETFYLGRAPAGFGPTRRARSYMTYGRVLHNEASFPIVGRFHVDRANSFLYDDAAIDGLVDAARLARLSLQTIARQSPGTCFTAMEIAEALRTGVHIPWKKNRPEEFKSGTQLVAADRGGVIFLPPVGVHDRVDEFDFASLYPHIMVRNNLSTETLDCRCCPGSPKRAPGLGYRSCTRRRGLIPRTLGPLLARRMAYKAILKDPRRPADERRRVTERARMLKWILVTSFGYQGYRNARFGRIECHEAINAYARELIARLIPVAEAAGYRVVHGLVDSLWVVPTFPRGMPDPDAFARRVSKLVDLPLGYEGRYRWIVFLPAVTHGLGVPNRYYGRYENGEFKLRGIGSRRHDTPTVLRRFEGEVLEALGKARSAAEVRATVPKVLARADLFAEKIREGTWPREELLVTHRLGQEPEAFVTFTDSVAAVRQLGEHGVRRSAGEAVRYLITDRRSRSPHDRVVVAERLRGDEPYDPGAYLELLARSAETLLAPLGVERTALLERWGAATAPDRHRYRSVERADQGRLDRVPHSTLSPGGS